MNNRSRILLIGILLMSFKQPLTCSDIDVSEIYLTAILDDESLPTQKDKLTYIDKLKAQGVDENTINFLYSLIGEAVNNQQPKEDYASAASANDFDDIDSDDVDDDIHTYDTTTNFNHFENPTTRLSGTSFFQLPGHNNHLRQNEDDDADSAYGFSRGPSRAASQAPTRASSPTQHLDEDMAQEEPLDMNKINEMLKSQEGAPSNYVEDSFIPQLMYANGGQGYFTPAEFEKIFRLLKLEPAKYGIQDPTKLTLENYSPNISTEAKVTLIPDPVFDKDITQEVLRIRPSVQIITEQDLQKDAEEIIQSLNNLSLKAVQTKCSTLELPLLRKLKDITDNLTLKNEILSTVGRKEFALQNKLRDTKDLQEFADLLPQLNKDDIKKLQEQFSSRRKTALKGEKQLILAKFLDPENELFTLFADESNPPLTFSQEAVTSHIQAQKLPRGSALKTGTKPKRKVQWAQEMTIADAINPKTVSATEKEGVFNQPFNSVTGNLYDTEDDLKLVNPTPLKNKEEQNLYKTIHLYRDDKSRITDQEREALEVLRNSLTYDQQTVYDAIKSQSDRVRKVSPPTKETPFEAIGIENVDKRIIRKRKEAQNILINRLDDLTEEQIKEALSFFDRKEYADEVLQTTQGRHNKALLESSIARQFPPKKLAPLLPVAPK